MKRKWDSWPLGIIAGIIGPVIVFTVYYLLNYTYMSIPRFVNYLIMGKVYTQLMSLCVIANLPIFFIFLQTDRYHSSRGVILVTIIYAILNFVLKFIA